MSNKQSRSGTRPLQLTIVFEEGDIAPPRTNHGTGSTQTAQSESVHSHSDQAIPTLARDASESTGKTARKRKWYSLWDKVYALPNLTKAWERVEENGGAGGVDGLTIEMFARRSSDRLEALSRDLQAKTYRPKPVRRVLIPKADGGTRPLGIPAIHDRIIQQALLQILTPIFEPVFSPRSHGFRPERGCQTALEVVDRAVRHGYTWVVDADIQGFFDNVDHDLLIGALNEEIADGSILNLLRAILEAGVVHPDAGDLEPTELGTPQGGPLSPLLANIYLHRLDRAMEGQFGLVRYADDFVIFARSQAEAEEALTRARVILEGELKLRLHPEKTRVVTVDSGFEFLGFHYHRTKKGLLMKEPRRKATQKFRDAVNARTPRIGNQRKPKKRSFTLNRLLRNEWLARLIPPLNRFLRGWYGYFRMAWLPPSTAFQGMDQVVRRRLRQALTGRLGIGWWQQVLPNRTFARLGLVSLREMYLNDSRSRFASVPARKG